MHSKPAPPGQGKRRTSSRGVKQRLLDLSNDVVDDGDITAAPAHTNEPTASIDGAKDEIVYSADMSYGTIPVKSGTESPNILYSSSSGSNHSGHGDLASSPLITKSSPRAKSRSNSSKSKSKSHRKSSSRRKDNDPNQTSPTNETNETNQTSERKRSSEQISRAATDNLVSSASKHSHHQKTQSRSARYARGILSQARGIGVHSPNSPFPSASPSLSSSETPRDDGAPQPSEEDQLKFGKFGTFGDDWQQPPVRDKAATVAVHGSYDRNQTKSARSSTLMGKGKIFEKKSGKHFGRKKDAAESSEFNERDALLSLKLPKKAALKELGYRTAKPYNLLLMSQRTLYAVYAAIYLSLIFAVIWSILEGDFTTLKLIRTPNLIASFAPENGSYWNGTSAADLWSEFDAFESFFDAGAIGAVNKNMRPLEATKFYNFDAGDAGDAENGNDAATRAHAMDADAIGADTNGLEGLDRLFYGSGVGSDDFDECLDRFYRMYEWNASAGWNHYESFKTTEEYVYLSAEFVFDGNAVSLDGYNNIYSYFEEKQDSSPYTVNRTVVLHVTGKDNSGNSKELGSYCKNEIVSINCYNLPEPNSTDADNAQNKTYKCDVWDIWSPYEGGEAQVNTFPAQWENTLLSDYDKGKLHFNTSIYFANIPVSKYGTLTLTYTKQNSKFTLAEVVVRGILCGITALLLIFWVYRLHSFKDGELVAEQRWMIVLFIATILYQDPLSISLLPSEMQTISITSQILFASAVNFFFVYWSLMIDSIREIKNVLDMGVTFGCKFYRGKIIFFVTSYIASLVFTILSAELILNNPSNYANYLQDLSDPTAAGMVVTGVIWLLCCSSFVLWLAGSIWRANKELGKLPYLETRERQLSLRLFKHHTAMLIFFIVANTTYSLVTTQSVVSLVDTRDTHLGSLLLMSVYAYTVAFIYLPCTQREISGSRHEFQLGIANFLCHISYQSYLSPPGTDPDKIRWFPMNLDHYSLQLLDCVYEEQHDVQLVICHGKIWSKFSKNKREMTKKNQTPNNSKNNNNKLSNDANNANGANSLNSLNNLNSPQNGPNSARLDKIDEIDGKQDEYSMYESDDESDFEDELGDQGTSLNPIAVLANLKDLISKNANFGFSTNKDSKRSRNLRNSSKLYGRPNNRSKRSKHNKLRSRSIDFLAYDDPSLPTSSEMPDTPTNLYKPPSVPATDAEDARLQQRASDMFNEYVAHPNDTSDVEADPYDAEYDAYDEEEDERPDDAASALGRHLSGLLAKLKFGKGGSSTTSTSSAVGPSGSSKRWNRSKPAPNSNISHFSHMAQTDAQNAQNAQNNGTHAQPQPQRRGRTATDETGSQLTILSAPPDPNYLTNLLLKESNSPQDSNISTMPPVTRNASNLSNFSNLSNPNSNLLTSQNALDSTHLAALTEVSEMDAPGMYLQSSESQDLTNGHAQRPQFDLMASLTEDTLARYDNGQLASSQVSARGDALSILTVPVGGSGNQSLPNLIEHHAHGAEDAQKPQETQSLLQLHSGSSNHSNPHPRRPPIKTFTASGAQSAFITTSASTGNIGNDANNGNISNEQLQNSQNSQNSQISRQASGADSVPMSPALGQLRLGRIFSLPQRQPQRTAPQLKQTLSSREGSKPKHFFQSSDNTRNRGNRSNTGNRRNNISNRSNRNNRNNRNARNGGNRRQSMNIGRVLDNINFLPRLRRRRRRDRPKYADIILGFRGTDSSINVKLDLKFSRITVDPAFWYGQGLPPELLENQLWQRCVRPRHEANDLNIPYLKIHNGFFQAFLELRVTILRTVLTTYHRCMRKQRIPRFFLTGHSLGGALAQLCGLLLQVLFGHRSQVYVYVYGSPRVGDREFASFVGKVLPHTYRVVYKGDTITTIPRGLGYYKHAGWEIIIDKHGNMIVDPTKTEKSVLPSRTSLKDHSLDRYMMGLNAVCDRSKMPHLILKMPDPPKPVEVSEQRDEMDDTEQTTDQAETLGNEEKTQKLDEKENDKDLNDGDEKEVQTEGKEGRNSDESGVTTRNETNVSNVSEVDVKVEKVQSSDAKANGVVEEEEETRNDNV